MDAKEKLTEITRGYQPAVVLLSACQSGLFETFREGAKSAEDAASELGLDFRATEMVLLALAAEGVMIQNTDHRFSIATEYAPFLLEGEPDSQIHIFRHNWAIMQSWCRLVETMRTGKPIPKPDEKQAPDMLRNFICGMADIARHSSREVAEKVNLSNYRKMLDVGGGPASASIAFCQKYPQLHATNFDLPAPTEIAREEVEKAGMTDRISLQAGNFLEDDLGSGYDLVYLSNIIHSLDEDETELVIGKCAKALDKGGTLIVKDFFLDDDRTSPTFAAYFSINMLVNTEGGKSYTEKETREIMSRAGFGQFKTLPVASASALLIGDKS
ncbi:MAG: methyltransferase [Candidatus Sumerlaeia bacterium]